MKKTARAHNFAADPRPDDAIVDLHGPIEPFEVYQSDGIEAELECRVDDKSLKMLLPVWRISPLGVELALPKRSDAKELLILGQRVNLRIKLRGQICEFQGLALSSTSTQSNHRLLGIRWFGESLARDSGAASDRRQSQRWVCDRDFRPIGVAPNPARFSDFVQFKVVDISASGMLLATSLRNRTLIPGMVLEATLIFPMCSQLSLEFQIRHTRVGELDGRRVLLIGVGFHQPDKKLLQSIGQYVFQFGPSSTIEELKKAGLPIDNVSRGIEFGYARTEREYADVLELRKTVVGAVDKLSADQSAEKFSDIYDTRARILTARHRGKLVASVRLIFPEMGDKFEIEEHVELPGNLPLQYASVEMSGLCLHPDFQHRELFYAIIRRALLTAVQSKRRWVYTFAPAPWVALLRKLGGKRTGLRFTHHNQEQEIVLWDVPRTLAGHGVGPFAWNMLVAELTDYARESDSFRLGPLMKARLLLYRALRPLAPFFLRNRTPVDTLR